MRRWMIGIVCLIVAGVGVAGWLHRHSIISVIHTVQQVVQPQPTVRFAVVGDNHGVNPVYQQIIGDIRSQPYAFLLNLADTSEDGTSAEFQAVKELESTLPFPVYHTVGSHDIKDDLTRSEFTNVFGHARWYAIDVGQVHLVILDNADRKIGFPDEELQWLERDLAAHPKSANLLAYHRPFGLPLALILGDDETSASQATNEQLTALLRRYRVAEIFTAHLHTYLPYTLAGVPAVVSGGGGDPAQLVLGGAKSNYFHYLDVTVRGTQVTVTPIRVTLRS